jgi:hypothetical protein
MRQITKVYKKVDEFPKHKFPLVFSFPPDMPYDDSHDMLIDFNLLIIKNSSGFTRVYSIGYFEEKDVEMYFQNTQ